MENRYPFYAFPFFKTFKKVELKLFLYLIKLKGGEILMAKNNKIGSWAFLIGVILAIVFAFVNMSSVVWILVLLGLLIGFFNIDPKEIQTFLFAGTVLVIVGAFAGQTLSEIMYLQDIFSNLVALFGPATIVVAIKSLFSLAKN